jgi:small neutral amino acid transporter SnatA (MarC family)
MLIHPSELASIIGAVVTLAGLVLTTIQLLRKSGRFNLTLAATLPGLVLACLGVILLVVGANSAPATTP